MEQFRDQMSITKRKCEK